MDLDGAVDLARREPGERARRDRQPGVAVVAVLIALPAGRGVFPGRRQGGHTAVRLQQGHRARGATEVP